METVQTSPRSSGNGRASPIYIVAAIAVIAFCATGIAALTGHLGSGQAAPVPAAVSSASPGVQAPAMSPGTSPAQAAGAVQPQTTAAPTAANAPAAPASAVAASAASAPGALPGPAAAPTQVAQAPMPPAVPAPRPVERTRPAAQSNVGTVVAIHQVDVSNPNNGVGAVAGGVLGGVVGHQIGSGRGNLAATVLGAAGGALAGNQVEHYQRRAYRYEVEVRTDTGQIRTLHYSSPPPFATGDRIPLHG